MKIPILYRDDDIVVVDKPVGLPTHAADPRDPYPGDVLRVVQKQLGLAYLGMHQRLDADTSGVLLFSARTDANRALAAVFEGRDVHKLYIALVQGRPRRGEGLIDAPLARARDGRYRVTSAGDRHVMPARTRYRVLHVLSPSATRDAGSVWGEAALLEIIPETGRTHQIRVHLAYIGNPVVGDALYGPGQTIVPRLFLHASELTLPHPSTGQPVSFTAPLPPAFQRVEAEQRGVSAGAAREHIRGAVARSPAAVTELVQLAIERRAPLANDGDTTIYRIVNGSGDGLPGLTLDRYGEVLVASLYDDSGTVPPEPAPPALVELLVDRCKPAAVYLKYRPRTASRVADEQLPLLAPASPVYGAAEGTREFVASEEGLRYLIRPGEGLSTGLFADMREGRARARAWATGRRVLNCFAYTCGFGVSAVAGGAARVLNLDLSKAALAWGQENYRLNGFEPDPHDFVFGDVFDWLARLAKRSDRFDLVILDPPGFSRTKARRFSAEQDYAELLALAARVTASQGQILACSNVAGQAWRSFRDHLLQGAETAGRHAVVEGVYHEPQVDFPAGGAAGTGHYLKQALLQLD